MLKAARRVARDVLHGGRGAATALACAIGLLAAHPAVAQAFDSEPAPVQTIHVAKDKSVALALEGPVERIVLAQPDTAEVDQVGPDSVYVTGKALGETNLLVYGPAGRLLQVVDVRVGYDAAQLQNDLAGALPGDTIQVSSQGEGLVLSGEVSSPAAAEIAKSIAENATSKAAVTSYLSVRERQVLLQVRLIEATESRLRDAGVDFDISDGSGLHLQTGTGLITANSPQGILDLRTKLGGLTIEGALGALEQKGVIHMLARPDLVAMSGEKASFHTGGEFPYPVPQGLNQISLEFRSYGVSVDMLPVIENGDRVRLHMRSELSTLDPANSLNVNGIQVPALTTRRVDTSVSLKDGQSLVVGGLLAENVTRTTRQVPLLGDLPHVGWLFQSTAVNRERTEFAVVVTARIVSHADILKLQDVTHAEEETQPLRLLKLDVAAADLITDANPAKAPVGPAPPRALGRIVVAHAASALRSAFHLTHVGWTRLETWAKAAYGPRYAARDAGLPADS